MSTDDRALMGADFSGGSASGAMDPSLDDLAHLLIWLAWQGEPKPGALPAKVPYAGNARGGRGSATNPKTWGSRSAARARAAALPKPCGLGGVGIVLTALDDGSWLCGIDLDTCRDPSTGKLTPWAKDVLTRFASYAEVSPSGTGVKLLFRIRAADREAVLSDIRSTSGSPEKEGTKWAHGTGEAHPPAIELFLGKRYFTVTDERLPAAPDRISLVEIETVRWLIHEVGPAFAQSGDDPRPADNSRSAIAFRIGQDLARQGATYEDFCAAVSENPETADWYQEKGVKYKQRELKKIWEKVTTQRASDKRFRVINGAICYMKCTRDGIEPVQLANFDARIVEEQILDDGVAAQRRYRIEGTLQNGTALPSTTIDAREITGAKWVNERWGAQAIVYPGAGVQMLEAAIKTVSGDVACRKIFTHLGWREIDGRWVYLHAGGAIGQEGPVAGVNVEITGTLAHFNLPPINDLNAAVRASLRMLDLRPVGTVIFAATSRAPLGVVSPAAVSVHLSGKTGSFKSAIEGVGQAHWGEHWNGMFFPANWSDTANDIEMKAFLAKDALFGIDEFFPGGRGRHHNDELHAKAERIYRGQANQSGRGRLDASMKERQVYWPRGLIISSGEDIPAGHSLRARVWIVEVQPGDIDPGKLTELQGAAKAGLLAQAMAGFVQYLAGKIGELRAEFPQRIEKLRREAIGEHRRTPHNYAELAYGCEIWLEFAVAVGAITATERDDRLQKIKGDLNRSMQAQDAAQRDEDIVNVFLEALGNALASGRVYAEDWETAEAPDGFEQACGWRSTRYRTSPDQDETVQWRANGDRVGWLADDQLYLITDAAVSCVERMLGHPLQVLKKTLIKRLSEAGAIASHDPGKNVKTVSNGNRSFKVLALKADRVLGAAVTPKSAPEAPVSGNGAGVAQPEPPPWFDDVPFCARFRYPK